MKRAICMLIFIASASIELLAGETHLDIKVPSLISGDFKGPVKSVEREYNFDMSDRKYNEVSLFDEAGNLCSRIRTNSKGETTQVLTNTFDEAGCWTSERVEDVRNATTNHYEIILNVPARKIAFKCKITGNIEVATYDEHKYRTGYTIRKPGQKNLPATAYKRDANHRTEHYAKYDDNGDVKYISVYEYDEQGRLKRTVTTYKQEQKKTLYVYEYLQSDDHGNWTQKLTQAYDLLDNKKKVYEQFTTRKIEYYESE